MAQEALFDQTTRHRLLAIDKQLEKLGVDLSPGGAGGVTFAMEQWSVHLTRVLTHNIREQVKSELAAAAKATPK